MKKRNRVFQKIENDYAEFKEEMTQLSPEEVFEYAYKIYCITEFYYILTNAYNYTSADIKTVLNFKGNFLEQVYQEWIDIDSSNQDEFEDAIEDTLYLCRTNNCA